MRKAAFLLLVIVAFDTSAQKADSLRAILTKKNLSDSSRSVLLSQLAEDVSDRDGNEAVALAWQGLGLSQKIDFEKGILLNTLALAHAYQSHSSFDTSNFYFRKALTLASSAKRQIYLGLGHNFMRLSKSDSSCYYLDLALNSAKKNNDIQSEAAVYVNYGNLLQDQGGYQKALLYLIDASKLYEKNYDQEGEVKTLANIGNVEYLLGNYEQALKYAKESLAKQGKNTLPAVKAYPHKLMGRIFRKLNKLDSALAHYQIAYAISKASGDKRSVTELLQNMGNILFDQQDFKKALDNYRLSLNLAKSIANKRQIAFSYSSIGMTYQAVRQFSFALFYLDSSRRIANNIHDPYLVMDAYESMSAIYQDQRDFEKALFYHQRFVQIKDSIAQVENKQAAEELRSKFEIEKKEVQITLLKKDQELNALALSRQRAIQTGIIVAALALLIIASLAINRYRVTNRIKRQLEIEKMRNALARDLHDDIGSALTSISIMSQMPSPEYTHRIKEQSAQIQERMADIVWSINPVNDSLEKMMMRMKEFAGEILEPKNISYLFEGEEFLTGAPLTVEKRKNVFLIFKEALNNTAKYSQASEVKINLSIHDHHLTLVVADNGKGFDSTQAKVGNGLNNMIARAEAIGGKLTISSQVRGGTSIILQMAVT